MKILAQTITFLALVLAPLVGRCDLFDVQLNPPGSTDRDLGVTTLSFSDDFSIDGIAFTLTFDATSSGGNLAEETDALGVTGGSSFNFDASTESITFDNLVLTSSSPDAGLLVLDGFVAFNFDAAAGANDAGNLSTDQSESIDWADLDDGRVALSIPAFSVTSSHSGGPSGSTGNVWRMDFVEISVSVAAIPEPTAFAFGTLITTGLVGLVARRRRKAAA